VKDVILTKESGYLQIDNTGALPAIGPTSHNVGNWIQSSSNVFYQALEIDIAGLTAQELTFYPLSGDVQRGPVSLGITGGFINEWMFVTASPIDPESIVPAYMNFGLLATGFIGPVTEFQNILWGRAWTWALNTAIPQNWAVQVNTTSLGSGEPTNGDRLYLYRFVTLQGQTPLSGFAELPDVRVILSGQVREEAEYQQLMRMRRTYQLQQSYDED
jgi:hypothetical protein